MFEGLMERKTVKTEPELIIPQQEAPKQPTESEMKVRAAEHELRSAQRKLEDIRREYETTPKNYPANPLQELVKQHLDEAEQAVHEWERKILEAKAISTEHQSN